MFDLCALLHLKTQGDRRVANPRLNFFEHVNLKRLPDVIPCQVFDGCLYDDVMQAGGPGLCRHEAPSSFVLAKGGFTSESLSPPVHNLNQTFGQCMIEWFGEQNPQRLN